GRAIAIGSATGDLVTSRFRLPGMPENAEAVRRCGAVELRSGPALPAVEAQLHAIDARLTGEGHSQELLHAGAQALPLFKRADQRFHVDLRHRLHLIGGDRRARGSWGYRESLSRVVIEGLRFVGANADVDEVATLVVAPP